MNVTSIVLPPKMHIRHRFLTASSILLLGDLQGRDLFESSCPSLRLKRRAIVSTVGSEQRDLLLLEPVWGLSGDIMISLSDEEILGVLQRVNEPDGTRWVMVDAQGKRRLTVRLQGSFLERLKKEMSLFASREKKFFADNVFVGSFVTLSGYVNERYTLTLNPVAAGRVDHRFLLAAAVLMTGLFERSFT